MTQFKLTLQDLTNEIVNTTYARFGDTGVHCTLTLKNGYTVTGEGSCIDPAIFDEEIGKKVAYENAFQKLWAILGYGVKQKWHEATNLSWLERVRIELAELDEKRSKLAVMLEDKPDFVSEKQWELMTEQYDAMSAYALILAKRIENT